RLSELWIYPNEDDTGEERAYRAGQLHVTARLPRTRIAAYRQTPALQEEKLLQTHFITFNTRRLPFDEARVRRAFSRAIDRSLLTSRVVNGLAEPAHSLSRQGLGGFDPPDVVTYDPDDARRLLAAAGFPNGVGFPSVEFRFVGN